MFLQVNRDFTSGVSKANDQYTLSFKRLTIFVLRTVQDGSLEQSLSRPARKGRLLVKACCNHKMGCMVEIVLCLNTPLIILVACRSDLLMETNVQMKLLGIRLEVFN